MLFGPMFWRELVIASRRRGMFRERVSTALVALALLAGCVGLWDYRGWDRESLAGIRQFARVIFLTVIAIQTSTIFGIVPALVAPVIARERDKKSLDALLATRLTSAEIVLGGLAAGLFRATMSLTVVAPIVLLMIPLGGIDPLWVAIACLGLASTAFAMGAISIVSSVICGTARHAATLSIFWMMGWIACPLWFVVVLPRLWPWMAQWIVPICLRMIESSPLSIVAHFANLLVRPGGLPEVMARMVAWEMGGSLLLILLAIWRLRPASRGIYDAEGRIVNRLLRKTRRRKRPPVGDDPVLWNEKYSLRGVGEWQLLLGEVIVLATMLCILAAVFLFARPAFKELGTLGYVASPLNEANPEMNSFVRMVVNGPLSDPPLGFARVEFNRIVRIMTVGFLFLMPLILTGLASETVTFEREKDTWLGLIATPLSGRAILRAKMLGTLWRGRGLLALGVGLWVVALISGALHPIGFVAILLLVSVTTWMNLAMGCYVSLWSRDRAEANSRVLIPLIALMSGVLLMVLPTEYASLWLAFSCGPVIGDLMLLSYDDVRAIVHTGAYPILATLNLDTGEGIGKTIAVCLVNLGLQASLATYFTLAAFRQFDAAVGRPVRGRQKLASDFEPKADAAPDQTPGRIARSIATARASGR